MEQTEHVLVNFLLFQCHRHKLINSSLYIFIHRSRLSVTESREAGGYEVMPPAGCMMILMNMGVHKLKMSREEKSSRTREKVTACNGK